MIAKTQFLLRINIHVLSNKSDQVYCVYKQIANSFFE